MRTLLAALTLAVALAACAGAQKPTPVVAVAPAAVAAPVAPGWQALFDGSTLAAWVTVGSAVWRIEDGVLVGTQDGDAKRSGVFHTRAEFTDFELELDFMIDEHGKYNSGVYLRNRPGARGRTGYQVNIGRGAASEYCGGVYTDRWLAKGDEQDAIRKPLAWNSLRIVAHGAHITVDLNGQRIVDLTDPAPNPTFLQPGVLALQTYGADGHAGWVKFRNIRIREISAPK